MKKLIYIISLLFLSVAGYSQVENYSTPVGDNDVPNKDYVDGSAGSMTASDINDSLKTVGGGNYDYSGNDTLIITFNENKYDTITAPDTLVIDLTDAQDYNTFQFRLNNNSASADTTDFKYINGLCDTIIYGTDNDPVYAIIPANSTCHYIGDKEKNYFIQIKQTLCLPYVAVDNDTAYLASAEVGDVTDSTVVMTFSKDIKDITMPATTAFDVTEGGVSVGINSVSRTSSTTISLVCDSTIEADSTILIDYTKPGSNPILTLVNDNPIDSWVDSTVTNNVTSGEVLADVVWTSLRDASAVGNDITSSATHGGGRSTDTISRSGTVMQFEIVSTSTGKSYPIGLKNSSTLVTHYFQLQARVYFATNYFCSTDGTSSSDTDSGVPPQVGDLVRLRIDGSTMRYEYYRSETWTELHNHAHVADTYYIQCDAAQSPRTIENVKRR